MKKTKFLTLALVAFLLSSTIGSAPIVLAASSNITKMDVLAQAPVIVPEELTTFDAPRDDFKSYTVNIPSGETQVVQPIQVDTRGRLFVDISGIVIPDALGLAAQLYSDEACTSKVDLSSYISGASPSNTLRTTIPTKGTYYLQIYFFNELTAQATIEIKPYTLSTEGKTLRNKTWSGTYNIDNGKYVYHKIIVPSPGYIKVEAKKNSTPNSMFGIRLFNSKKQALTDDSAVTPYNDNSEYYAVKKGTYYIGVKELGDYKIRYTYKAIKPTGGSSKSKATTIKKGSTVSGLMHSGDSMKKSSWYKVTLPSTRYLSLSIKGSGNEIIRFDLIPANSQITLSKRTTHIINSASTTLKSDKPLAKGTYYIRVTKNTTSASGYYQIKFN